MGQQRVNAGGTLAPEHVIGRDEFIAKCWRILDTQGLYITGERRMGKSSVVRDKMGSTPAPGFKLIYLDVSDANSPLAFVNSLFIEAKKLGKSSHAKLAALEILKKGSGLEIANVFKLPDSFAPEWKEMLRIVIGVFADQPERVVLAFDEMPIMLDKIKRSSDEAVAMDILDTLRKERQTNKNLRMIYTGSLGLHHVLTDLQDKNYQNSPVNDLKRLELEPLSQENATDLAQRLLRGMHIECKNIEALSLHLAYITDGMPFYIQNLVGDLADSDKEGTTLLADRFLTDRIRDMDDPWDFGYYQSRIDTHYQPAMIPLAFAFLDQLAISDTPRSLTDLQSALNSETITFEKETTRRTLALLGKDHYIDQDDQGAFRFRYPLIARAWAFKRSLLNVFQA